MTRKKKHPQMNPVTHIAIVNKSKLAGLDAALPAIVAALGKQLARDYQPVWGTVLPTLELTKTPGPDAVPFVLLDNPDVADALGYHDETPDGMPYARVFVDPILQNGGTVSTTANSISVTMSHELLELLGDVSANLWADAPDGADYARELCDAVEADAYTIDGVAVSNFVYPAFFDPEAATGSRFDHLGNLHKPFAMDAGGYQIKRTEGGRVTQVFGDSYPEWKKDIKRAGLRYGKRAARKGVAA